MHKRECDAAQGLLMNRDEMQSRQRTLPSTLQESAVVIIENVLNLLPTKYLIKSSFCASSCVPSLAT